MDSYSHAIGVIRNAVSDDVALSHGLAAFLQLLGDLGEWSHANPKGRQIHWRLAREARDHLPHLFDAPGVYLFGVKHYPIYVGMTKGTLWKRLSRRYLIAPYGQLILADTYSAPLVAQGIEGFPPEVRAWYADNFGSSTVRLRHAVEMARLGVASIWIGLLPLSNPEEVKPLEEAIIRAASALNASTGAPRLLNQMHA